MIFRNIRPLLLILVAVSTSWTQAAADPQPEPVEFRVIGWNRTHLDMFYEIKGKPVPLRLVQGVVSEPQRYTGAPTVTFYIPVQIEGKPGKKPLATVTLNRPPQKNLVVIWLPKTGDYESTVLVDEPDRPSPGKLRFVNLSGGDLIVQCNGGTPLPLAAGADSIVAPQNDGIGVKVAMETKANGQWKIGLMTGITVRPYNRVTAFIVNPSRIAPTLEALATSSAPNSAALDLFVIRDRVIAK